MLNWLKKWRRFYVRIRALTVANLILSCWSLTTCEDANLGAYQKWFEILVRGLPLKLKSQNAR